MVHREAAYLANEVTVQKETLTPPKVPPSTLDQASKLLEEMQRQLNLRIKSKQNVHRGSCMGYTVHEAPVASL